MLYKQFIFPLVTVIFLFPAAISTSAIEVQAPNMRINTNPDGSIDIKTEQTQLQVPSNRLYYPINSRFTLPNRQGIRMNCSKSGNLSHQETTQIIRSTQVNSQTQVYTYQDC